MAPKILDMLWHLAMPSGSPAELLAVIVDVIALYDKTRCGTLKSMLNRCIEIQKGSIREPDVNSLRLLVELVKLQLVEEVGGGDAGPECCNSSQKGNSWL